MEHQPLRIVHFASECDNIGNGIVNVAIDLAVTQSLSGNRVVFASRPGSYEPFLMRHGVTFTRIPHPRRPYALLAAVVALIRLVRAFQPDIIHAHMPTSALIAHLAKRFGRFALITTVHNEFSQTARFMGCADRVIAVSETGREKMVRSGVPPCRVSLVRNGPLNSPRQQSRANVPLPLRRPAVVTVAGMNRRKGIFDLLHAFNQAASKHPEAQLYMVGDGPDRKEAERLARTLAVAERVHFEGFQDRPERYMRAADIFVLASHAESSPLVIAEARHAGAAIVATAVNGVPELLEQGAAGILLAPGDSRALADTLDMLLRDQDMLARWRARAAANLEWLSIQRVQNEVAAVYQSALRERLHGALYRDPEAQDQ